MDKYNILSKHSKFTCDSQGNILELVPAITEESINETPFYPRKISLIELDNLEKYIKECEDKAEFICIQNKILTYFEELETVYKELISVVSELKTIKYRPDNIRYCFELEKRYDTLRSKYLSLLNKLNIK